MRNRTKHSHDWWLSQIDSWKSTDLSIAAFCNQNDLSRDAFKWHLHQEKIKAESGQVTIMPICMDEPSITVKASILINGVSIQGDIHTLRKILGIQL